MINTSLKVNNKQCSACFRHHLFINDSRFFNLWEAGFGTDSDVVAKQHDGMEFFD